MEYTVENEIFTLTAAEHGGELVSLRRKAEPDMELIWDAKPEHWARHAPLLFPWCGRVDGNWYEYSGKKYEKLPQHGFVRDMEHRLASISGDSLTFVAEHPGDGTRWPRSFKFETVYRLSGNVVETVCTGTNTSDAPMPAQLGFHAGLSCPFTKGAGLEDYLIRFDEPEAPNGTDAFPLDRHSFDNDSICFPNPRSRWLQVEERDTGRYMRVDTEGFPFVLIWSALGAPGFVCIEPWTGFLGEGHDLAKRPGTRILAPGESIRCLHRLSVCL